MLRTNCIDRAGQILISCIWIEKRLIDLLVLKAHPRLIKKLNNSIILPRTLVKERIKLWELDFSVIKDKFIKEFNPKKCWEENLIGIYHWRNIISHSHLSLYRDYLLFRPQGGAKRTKRLNKDLEPIKQNNACKPTLYLLRLSDDRVYNRIIAVIHELDQKYLRYEAEHIGINYEKIR